jgi:hypothetical protein
MLQGEKYNYAIIKTNHRTGAHSVEDVVKGESVAAGIAERNRGRLTDEERQAGWSFYAERTTQAVWHKPVARGSLKGPSGKS